HWNRECTEIIRAYLAILNVWHLVERFRRRSVLNAKKLAPVAVGERHGRGYAGRFNRRKRFDSIDQLMKKSRSKFRTILRVLGFRQRYPQSKNMVGTETRIDALQAQQAVDQKTGAYQENE